MSQEENIALYKIWAPDDALWTQWAKPVIFAHLMGESSVMLDLPSTNWLPTVHHDTMIIVDLPGKRSVETSLALAEEGFRPVPLYNGVNIPNQPSSMVNAREIISALFTSAEKVRNLHLPEDAPPVFMLDANRMEGGTKKAGKYDNRWSVFPQDMPSAHFLLQQNIEKVIVCTSEIKIDLSHILYRYQEKNIEIYLYDDIVPLKAVKISKPSGFKSLFYRFKVMLGLTRNSSGGFGGIVPEASSGSG